MMRPPSPWRALVAITGALACSAQDPPESTQAVQAEFGGATERSLVALEMRPSGDPVGSRFEATAGDTRFILFEPDDPAKPTAWEGPLRIESSVSGSSCEAPVSLVTSIYTSPQGELAVVLSYSGSLVYVSFVDGKTCSERWPKLEAFSERIEIADDRILIHPGCECDEGGRECSCSAARVYSLGMGYRPELDDAASSALTQRDLGVAFAGRKKIAEPRSPRARVVD